MEVEMVELDLEMVETVDQAEAVVLVVHLVLTQAAQEILLQQILLKETMVVIHLQLIFKLLVAAVVLVLLEQMVHKVHLVEMAVPVVLV
jgi:hypothetical protein